ncbi:MAG: hypothetical protein ABW185_01830 [Sedimenticola sp.]
MQFRNLGAGHLQKRDYSHPAGEASRRDERSTRPTLLAVAPAWNQQHLSHFNQISSVTI